MEKLHSQLTASINHTSKLANLIGSLSIAATTNTNRHPKSGTMRSGNKNPGSAQRRAPPQPEHVTPIPGSCMYERTTLDAHIKRRRESEASSSNAQHASPDPSQQAPRRIPTQSPSKALHRGPALQGQAARSRNKPELTKRERAAAVQSRADAVQLMRDAAEASDRAAASLQQARVAALETAKAARMQCEEAFQSWYPEESDGEPEEYNEDNTEPLAPTPAAPSDGMTNSRWRGRRARPVKKAKFAASGVNLM